MTGRRGHALAFGFAAVVFVLIAALCPAARGEGAAPVQPGRRDLFHQREAPRLPRRRRRRWILKREARIAAGVQDYEVALEVELRDPGGTLAQGAARRAVHLE